MPAPSVYPVSRLFGDFATSVAHVAGRASAFVLAVVVIIVWAATGPVFHFSDTWQLIINTGTTIITFLMVFLIQNSQNRDSAAIQVKLDELILVSKARNMFVGIEQLTAEEIEELRKKMRVSRERAGEWQALGPRCTPRARRIAPIGAAGSKSFRARGLCLCPYSASIF
jgi:low affinity Fe/Cu permease